MLEFTYTDYAHGKTDNIEIKLENRDGLFNGNWFPNKGSVLKPTITYENKTLPCGSFEIDEVEFSSPPDVVIMRAVSSFISKSFRLERKTRNYENETLRQIAESIANNNNFKLFYDAEDKFFDRVSQKEESDLAFLKRLCEETGKHLKVNEEKIIVFEGKKYDEAEAMFNFVRGKSDIISFRFTTKAHDVYKACEVSYFDEKSKILNKYIFSDDNVRVGHLLKINKRANSLAEAEKIAKSELRKRNKHETEGVLIVMGNCSIAAGLNINISNFGVFDGKYFIEEAQHRINENGYTTQMRIRRVLCY